jgi:hypothetical protein
MAIVPGEKIGGLRPVGILPPRQSDCYGHDIDDGTRCSLLSKPSRSFPRPLSDLLGATLGDALKAQGFASTEIISRWTDIVGTEIAAHSEPLKINWPRGIGDEAPEPATLVLRVEGPAALEIQHLSSVILERVNRFFGWQAIGRIALRQAPLRHREQPPPREPDPAVAARIAEGLPDVKDEDLRQALARLGAAIKRN